MDICILNLDFHWIFARHAGSTRRRISLVGERNATVGQGLTFHCGNGLSAAEVAKIYEQEMPAGMVRKSSKWIYCSNSPTGDNLGGHTSSWYTIFETSLRKSFACCEKSSLLLSIKRIESSDFREIGGDCKNCWEKSMKICGVWKWRHLCPFFRFFFLKILWKKKVSTYILSIAS